MCSCHKQSGALVFWSGSAEEKNREWGADGLHFLCITHDDEHCLFKFEEGIDGSDSFIFKPCLEKSTLKTVFFLQAFPLALLTLLVSQLALAAAILGLLGGIFYTVAAALLLAVSIGSANLNRDSKSLEDQEVGDFYFTPKPCKYLLCDDKGATWALMRLLLYSADLLHLPTCSGMPAWGKQLEAWASKCWLRGMRILGLAVNFMLVSPTGKQLTWISFPTLCIAATSCLWYFLSKAWYPSTRLLLF